MNKDFNITIVDPRVDKEEVLKKTGLNIIFNTCK